MEKNNKFTEFVANAVPYGTLSQGAQFPELTVPAGKIHEAAEALKNYEEQPFDYLVSLTAVDHLEKITMVYHLESTLTHTLIVLKADLEERDNAKIDTVSDLWITAEFHEREVFDLFGIHFNNHPDMRRLFLEDDYGFPLRKDFKDDVNIIEYSN
ncbi:MAG: NADH-quinone oxidoreductase subunit C [Chlorobi bacterium]|nr:NADH-quinone oxidoreductase subunit C [Chlorobiota bacterium]